MTPEETALRRSIEELYDAFCIYPLAEVIEGCPCCTTEADHARIHSKPLRQLTGKDLDRFAMKALSTWGELEDFKHFLPRLLELLPFEGGFTMPVALVGKLMYTGTKNYPSPTWLEWPDEERLALEEYFCALWAWVLTKPLGDGDKAIDWLGILAEAVQDLRPLLDLWRSYEESSSAVAQLAYLMFWHDGELQVGRLDSPYWHNNHAGARQVTAWSQDPRTRAMLKRELPRIRHLEWLDTYGVSQYWIDWLLDDETE